MRTAQSNGRYADVSDLQRAQERQHKKVQDTSTDVEKGIAMGTVTILDAPKNPITLIGARAGVCWGADTSDDAKNYKRGLDCIQSGHGRTLEFVSVDMLLDGYSARVMREWYTHIGGAPTRLQASTRYIDYHDFECVIPPEIEKDIVKCNVYCTGIQHIRDAIQLLEEHGAKREDAAMLLPLGMTTRVVDKRNLRNLVDMSRQRMCNRAFWEFRQLFDDISVALAYYSDEWGYIVDNLFYAKCEPDRKCPEKHGCGKYPNK